MYERNKDEKYNSQRNFSIKEESFYQSPEYRIEEKDLLNVLCILHYMVQMSRRWGERGDA